MFASILKRGCRNFSQKSGWSWRSGVLVDRTPKLPLHTTLLKRRFSQAVPSAQTHPTFKDLHQKQSPPPLPIDETPPDNLAVDDIVLAVGNGRCYVATVSKIITSSLLQLQDALSELRASTVPSNSVCLSLGLKGSGVNPKDLYGAAVSQSETIPVALQEKLIKRFHNEDGTNWFTTDEAAEVLFPQFQQLKLNMIKEDTSHITDIPQFLNTVNGIRLVTIIYLHRNWIHYRALGLNVFYCNPPTLRTIFRQIKTAFNDTDLTKDFLDRVKKFILSNPKSQLASIVSLTDISIPERRSNFPVDKLPFTKNQRMTPSIKRSSSNISSLLQDDKIEVPVEAVDAEPREFVVLPTDFPYISALELYGSKSPFSRFSCAMPELTSRLLEPLGLYANDATALLNELGVSKDLPELIELNYNHDGYGPVLHNFHESVIEDATKISAANILSVALDEDHRIRKNFTHLPSFAIDSKTTTEVDDSITIETKADGTEWIHIHIAEPARLIKPNSIVDLDARRRSSSIYLPHKKYTMLHSMLAEDALTLKESENNYTLTVSVKINPETGVLEDYDVNLSYSNVIRITFDDVEHIISSNPPQLDEFGEEYEANPNLTGPHIKIIQRLHQLSQVRAKLREKTIGEPSILSQFSKEVKIKPNGEIYLQDAKRTPLSSKLVEEMMVLAGEAVSQFTANNQIPVAYRVQPSFVLPEDLHSDPMVQELQSRFLRPRAQTTTTIASHASVGLDSYLRITSPLRRYPDLISSYQIKEFLRNGKSATLPFDTPTLSSILHQVHHTSKKVDLLQNRADFFWKRKYFQRYCDGKIFEGIVFSSFELVNKFGSKTTNIHDVYIPDLDHSFRFSNKAFHTVNTGDTISVVLDVKTSGHLYWRVQTPF
eukprot:TRINITY_DN7140_c0_g1_i1.p1 TRINITY_DN7140_c0_g1~~TRINITY_DN7140_c0_g1_i1.p1  ORF type:complete len:884 (-),score=157.62 TRINITY_DN7140_c0_g1_i1:22-2673(-)